MFSRFLNFLCCVTVVFIAQLFFSASLLANLGNVPLSLRSDFEDLSNVHAGLIRSLLHDCKKRGCSGIVMFFTLTLVYNLGTSFTGTSDSVPFLCVVDAILFCESSSFSFSCLDCLKRVSRFFFLVTNMKGFCF